MKKVTILALDNAMSSSVMGTMDIFCQAGYTWPVIMDIEPEPYFDVEIVTQDGKPVKSFNNAPVYPHRAIDEVKSTDLIIISSFYDFDTLTSNKGTISWLKEQIARTYTSELHHQNQVRLLIMEIADSKFKRVDQWTISEPVPKNVLFGK